MIALKVKKIVIYRFLAIVAALAAAMAITVSATVSFSDLEVSISVKGYYTQYGFSSTQTSHSWITADGTVNTNNSVSMYLSNYIDVSGYNYLFYYRTSDNAKSFFRHIAAYDENQNIVPLAGYDTQNSGTPSSPLYFYHIPDGVKYVRVSQNYTSSPRFVLAMQLTSTDYLNNYFNYVYNRIEDISIVNDNTVTSLYQVNGYNYLMFDFQMFDYNRSIETLSFDTFMTYTDSDGTYQYDLSKDVVLYVYQINADGSVGQQIESLHTQGNPHSWTLNLGNSKLAGFRLLVPAPLVTGSGSGVSAGTYVSIQFDNFNIDGLDVAARLEAQSAMNDLQNAADSIAVPTPDTAFFDSTNNVVSQYNDPSFSLVNWWGSNTSVITAMLVTVLTFAALGYILFGKVS